MSVLAPTDLLARGFLDLSSWKCCLPRSFSYRAKKSH